MFVAVAAAGMLASCSSDSLTAGPDPKIEPTQDELVPIEISVASPSARAITRGTGTVGGVVNGTTPAYNDGETVGTPTPKANIWAGQKVNVYMFNKGTLDIAQFNGADLFNNAEMVTPAASEGLASGLAHYVDPAASGRYLVKYYPLSDAYDFWGYRIDDAKNADGSAPAGAPAKNGDKYQVEIKVDGSQDVLGAKTTVPDISGTTLTTADLYSAKAARQNIQPELDFNHLMTRLTFEAYPGNDNAKTVYVTGIKVRAINDATTDPTVPVYQTPVGTLDIAGTGYGFEQKINWVTSTVAPDPFVLMKRLAVVGQDAYTGIAENSWYALTAATTDNTQFITKAAYDAIDKIKSNYTVLAAGSWYSLNTASTDNTQFIDATAYVALPDGAGGKGDYTAIAADSWYSLNTASTDKTQFIDATAYAALPEHAQGDYTLLAADSWYARTAATTDNTQFISATAYGTLPATSTTGDPDGNMNLVALTDGTNWATNGAVSMTFGSGLTDGTEKAPIGESIIAPDAQAYEIEIDLAQKVAKYEDSDPAVPGDYDEYQFNSIKTVVKLDGGATRFEPSYTYDFIFKVYGLEKIQVKTTLEPWIWGEKQEIITE